jgi:hypothetical protein
LFTRTDRTLRDEIETEQISERFAKPPLHSPRQRARGKRPGTSGSGPLD